MKNFIEIITAPFTAIAVLVDESRRNNEDGSWDNYNRKQNYKAELRDLKSKHKADRVALRKKWEVR